MKRNVIGELKHVLAVLVPGAVATWVVLRTLSAYWEHDSLASLVVAAIGVGLLAGLGELLVRQVRAGMFEREVRGLPPLPSEVTLDTASPLVGSMLRARLENAPLPNLGEGLAPFLSGLLVMLGLLGTLLGLFQTVKGAGHALTSSGDVDALRRSLSAPLDGLTRSFGCSAAGISASAMLGLALAFVRRRESAAMRVFQRYAAGPLRVLSPARRTTASLEQLVERLGALPTAASAIEGVGTKLDSVASQLVDMQQTAIKSQHRVFSELLASARAELTKASEEAADALHGRVAPLLEKMSLQSSESLAAQAKALAEGANKLAQESITRQRELSDDLVSHQRELLNGLSDGQRELLAQISAGTRELLSDIAASQQQLSVELGETHRNWTGEIADRQRELLTQLELHQATTASSDAARIVRLDAHMESVQKQDERSLRALEQLEIAARAVQEAGMRQESGLERLMTRFAEIEAVITAERDTHARGLADQLREHATGLEERLAKASEAVQEAAAVWRASSTEMHAVVESFASSVERQREASDAWLESLGDVEGSVERAGRDAARDALSDQLASTQEVLARQLQFQRELFEQLRMLRGEHAPAAARTQHGDADVSV